ncbi:50S ribosomal protein L19 [Candidatus Dojkabacteria bacterium]|nr:50S ribosomal protein L19 [Candidatus Dojkabacteria bacterium]
MNTQVIKKAEEKQTKKRPDVKPGDTVKLHLLIKDRGNVREQIFEGTVISIKGSGMSRMLTVRKMSSGVGVEKIIPVNSPSLAKIEIVKRGQVRRSKLFYMRKKIGKRALEVNKAQSVYFADEEETPAEASKDESDKDEAAEAGAEGKKDAVAEKDQDSGAGDSTEGASDKGQESDQTEKSEESDSSKDDSPEES